MKKSFASTMVALEEFAEDVNSEIVADQPTDGEFGSETAGIDYPEESGAIDEDLAKITESAQGLEDIISLIDEAPGAPEAPLEPFAAKAVNVALESNDLVAAAGNPADGETTKAGVLEKVKAFAKKIWEMLRNFGKRIAAWIRETWTKYTDRIVKNAAHAQRIIDATKNLATDSGAKITDSGLLAKIATYKNVEVGEVLMAVSEHAQDQGGKAAEALTKECRTCIDVVASGASSADGVMDRFTKALAQAAGSYDEEATAEQTQAVKAAASTKTLVTKPFFGGYRAWVSVPENADALQYWNHGISKVDEVKPQAEIAAPNGEEIKAIAEYVVGLGDLVKIYQNNVKQLDDLNKELDRAASKANAGDENSSKQLKAMQAVVPRIIKGPQVAAYAYAASASTIALQYCSAAISAHRGEKSLGEKVKEAGGSYADSIKAKAKDALGKKGE